MRNLRKQLVVLSKLTGLIFCESVLAPCSATHITVHGTGKITAQRQAIHSYWAATWLLGWRPASTH